MLELLAPVYSKSKEYKKALQQIAKMQSLLGDLQVSWNRDPRLRCHARSGAPVLLTSTTSRSIVKVLLGRTGIEMICNLTYALAQP